MIAKSLQPQQQLLWGICKRNQTLAHTCAAIALFCWEETTHLIDVCHNRGDARHCKPSLTRVPTELWQGRTYDVMLRQGTRKAA